MASIIRYSNCFRSSCTGTPHSSGKIVGKVLVFQAEQDDYVDKGAQEIFTGQVKSARMGELNTAPSKTEGCHSMNAAPIPPPMEWAYRYLGSPLSSRSATSVAR